MADQLAPAPRGAVTRRDSRRRKRPLYGEVGVVERDGQIFARVVRTIDAIADIGGRREGLKAMQKPLRHIEVQKFGVVEPDAQLMTEGRRVRPDVDDDVVYRSVRASDEFGFALSRPAVHPADGPLHRPGLRVLQEGRAQAGSAEIFIEDVGIEGSGEQAAFVGERLGDEDDDAGDSGLSDPHGAMLP